MNLAPVVQRREDILVRKSLAAPPRAAIPVDAQEGRIVPRRRRLGCLPGPPGRFRERGNPLHTLYRSGYPERTARRRAVYCAGRPGLLVLPVSIVHPPSACVNPAPSVRMILVRRGARG